jgi:hypothetical protein
VDHPPLSIGLLWLSRAILGDSLPAIRLLPALAGAATVFLTGLIARELGGRRPAQLVAAGMALVAPFFLGVNHFFSMNSFDLLFWTILVLIATQVLAQDEPRRWVVFGVVAGLGLLNKYSVAFLGFGVVAGLLFTDQRRHLASRWIWIGGVLAVVLVLPHLLWQVQHGWPSVEFIATAQADKFLPVTPVEFLLGQVVLMHPVLFPVWLTGLGLLLFSSRMQRFRALGFAYIAILVLLMIQQAKVYYLAPAYPVLFAAGAVAFDELVAKRGWRWAFPAFATLLIAGGLALLPMALPVLPVESYIAYARVLGIEEPQMERGELGQLPQQYADMHGWEEMVRTVRGVYERLPPEERSRAAIFTGNYGEAGAIDFLGRAYGLPRAISGHNSYHLWGPGDYSGEVLIFIGGSVDELSDWFEEVEHVDTHRCTYCMPHEDNLPIHVCRQLRVPVAEAWDGLGHYD